MTEVLAWVSALLLIIGIGFSALAALSILRMPDSLMRLLATSKAPTLGVACIYLAVGLQADEATSFFRALLVIAFTLLTIPAGAHALGLAAYLIKTPLWPGTRVPSEMEELPQEQGDG